MVNKSDFFEDIATQLEFWIESSVDVMSNDEADLVWIDKPCSFKSIQGLFSNNKDKFSDADLKQVLSECLRGYTISILSVLDGGTPLAEKGRVYLTDEFGGRLGDGLHDEFVSYLIESGKLE